GGAAAPATILGDGKPSLTLIWHPAGQEHQIRGQHRVPQRFPPPPFGSEVRRRRPEGAARRPLGRPGRRGPVAGGRRRRARGGNRPPQPPTPPGAPRPPPR